MLVPLAVLFLACYLVGFRIYQNRISIPQPPATVLAPEEIKDTTLAQGEKINLNLAEKDDLVRLPGVGETLALRILERRQALGGFGSIEELKEVKGIGDKLYQNIKEYLVLK